MSSSRWLAVLASAAILALGVAACGGSSSSSSSEAAAAAAAKLGRSLSGEIAGAGSSAQQAAQEAWIAELRERKLGRDALLRPGRLGRRPRTVHRRRRRLRRQRHAPLRRRRRARRRAEALRTGRTGRGPGLHLADRDRLQPPGSRRTAARPGNPGEDLQPGNRQLERPGDRQRQPRRRTARHPDHPGQPLRRVGHDGKLHRLPLRGRAQRLDATKPAATGRSRAAKPPHGTSGVVEAVAAGEGAIGYADASQAGELGIAKIKVGSEYVEPTAEAAAEVLEESSKTRN